MLILINSLLLVIAIAVTAFFPVSSSFIITAAVLLGLGATIFLVKSQAGQKRLLINRYTDEIESLKEHLLVQEKKTVAAEAALEASQKLHQSNAMLLDRISENVQIFSGAIPILDALTQRVVQRTESSNIALSDRIFSITGASKQVNEDIRNVFYELVDGDTGLQRGVNHLNSEADRLSSLTRELNSLGKRYLRDMSTLKDMVGKIGSFTTSLTDLADQTNLLSITTSIEAARAGQAGNGFRIIASEVQQLAQRSKSIAEQINDSIQDAAGAVESSFNEQEETLEDSIGQIIKSQELLSNITSELQPKLEKISTSIEKSKDLSVGVSENLDGIIVSLQYHDIVRQILEHCISILGDVKELCSADGALFTDERILKNEKVNELVRDIAKNHFTVDDEWEVIGLSVKDTSNIEKREQTKRKHKLEGDITLF